MNRLLIVVGTRPNFIKITQFKKVNEQMGNPFEIAVVHTGQHYDSKMADVFFTQFDLVPDYYLDIPHGSANMQMAEIMLRLEKTIQTFKPDVMLVVGDVNSTFAAALTANKCQIKIAHVESGLRSNDKTMPEEFNRILTDVIADYYFVTEDSGRNHLLAEGKTDRSIFFVGNTMIDTLVAFEQKINADVILNSLQLDSGQYALMTMHRPATVDFKEGLEKLLDVIKCIIKKHHLVFPVHPRTLQKLNDFGLRSVFDQLQNEQPFKLLITEPLPYFAFQKLTANCMYVITDSGGIQEETTFMQVPCLTLRANTERPVTVTLGSNQLIPFDVNIINNKIIDIGNGNSKKGAIPPLWDGKATERILQVLKQQLL